jgi:hypothetical protein
MANTPEQLGTAYKIGVGSLAYTGFLLVDKVTREDTCEELIIKGVDNETTTVISMNRAKTFKGSFYIVSNGSVEPPDKNTTVTLTPPEGTSTIWRVNAASVDVSRELSVLTLDLIKEASMTYT